MIEKILVQKIKHQYIEQKDKHHILTKKLSKIHHFYTQQRIQTNKLKTKAKKIFFFTNLTFCAETLSRGSHKRKLATEEILKIERFFSSRSSVLKAVFSQRKIICIAQLFAKRSFGWFQFFFDNISHEHCLFLSFQTEILQKFSEKIFDFDNLLFFNTFTLHLLKYHNLTVSLGYNQITEKNNAGKKERLEIQISNYQD